MYVWGDFSDFFRKVADISHCFTLFALSAKC